MASKIKNQTEHWQCSLELSFFETPGEKNTNLFLNKGTKRV